MPRNYTTRSVLTAALLSLSSLMAPEAAAGVVTMDQPAGQSEWGADLSTLSAGLSVSSLGFTALSLSEIDALSASVTTTSSNNAITDAGWWRLRGGQTTLTFDHALEMLRFEYAHEHNAAVEVEFLDAGGSAMGSVTLDSRDDESGSVAFTSDEGESFTAMRLNWTRASGHAMSLGPVFTANAAPVVIPGPGGLGLIGMGALLVARRGRPRG